MVFADRKEPVPGAIEAEVGIPPGNALGRQGLQDARRRDPVQPAGGELRDDGQVAVDEIGPAAVLVDPAPGIEAFRRQAGQRAIALTPDEDLSTALLAAAFEPPARPAGRANLTERDGGRGEQLDRERRRPGPER